jgi:flagellar export protein FliJ
MTKAWDILGRLAEQRAESAYKSVADLDRVLMQLEERAQKIVGMIEEQRALLNGSAGGRLSMAQMRDVSQFVQRLANVLTEAKRERAVMLRRRAHLVEALRLAKDEERKMHSLQERDASREAKAVAVKEQARMDAAATARFNQTRRQTQRA